MKIDIVNGFIFGIGGGVLIFYGYSQEKENILFPILGYLATVVGAFGLGILSEKVKHQKPSATSPDNESVGKDGKMG